MTENNDISFSLTKAHKIGIIIVFFATSGYGLFSFASGYHDKFATESSVSERFSGLNREIIELAIVAKEDELSLIIFKEGNGEATPLDIANKANIERRLADLKHRLDEIE